MVLVTDFARGVSVPRPLPAPPSPCTRWVALTCSLVSSLILTISWVTGYIWLFVRLFSFFTRFFLSETCYLAKLSFDVYVWKYYFFLSFK